MNMYNKRHAIKILHLPEYRSTGERMKRSAVTNIIKNANNQRLLSGDATQVHIATISDPELTACVREKKIQLDQKNSMRRSSYPLKSVHFMRENSDGGILNRRAQDDYNIKIFQYRKQQAELK
ncbi:unnamed protein product, partial [Rotaria sp. Silwood1]